MPLFPDCVGGIFISGAVKPLICDDLCYLMAQTSLLNSLPEKFRRFFFFFFLVIRFFILSILISTVHRCIWLVGWLFWA